MSSDPNASDGSESPEETTPPGTSDEQASASGAEPPEPTPPGFDVGTTLAGLVGAYNRINGKMKRGQASDVAAELCSALTELQNNAGLWDWLRQLQPLDPQDRGEITAFIDQLDDFENDMAKRLTLLRLDGQQAQILSNTFANNLYTFRQLLQDAGPMVSPQQAVTSMQFYLSEIAQKVCHEPSSAAIEEAVGALGEVILIVAAAAPAAAAVLPVAVVLSPVAAAVLPLIGGVLILGSRVVRHVRNRRG